jgi:Spy/CpxP family protein refolding chaperone
LCAQEQALQNFTLLHQSLSRLPSTGAEIEVNSAGGFDMKRIIIWSSVGFMLAAIGILALRADGPMRHAWGPRGWGSRGPLGYVAHQLKLSDAQKSQVESMWKSERPTIASLIHDLASENDEMDAATAKGSIDESKLQAIASRQGDTVAKLLVEKEHFEAKVYTNVLNPEQRTRADELQKRWHSRLYHIAARIGNRSGESRD